MATKKNKNKKKTNKTTVDNSTVCPDCYGILDGDYCLTTTCRRRMWPVWVPAEDLKPHIKMKTVLDAHGLEFTGLRCQRKVPAYAKLAAFTNPSIHEQDEELSEAVRQDEFDNVIEDQQRQIDALTDRLDQETDARIEDLDGGVDVAHDHISRLKDEVAKLTTRVAELENVEAQRKRAQRAEAKAWALGQGYFVGSLGKPEPAFGQPADAPVYTPRPLPYNHGAIWTTSDEGWLRRAYRDGTALAGICRYLGRTPFAVFMRLVKLGLVNENNVFALWEQGVDTYSRSNYV